MNGERVSDPGLQPERTLLAWHRTSLALAVAGAVASRLLAQQLPAPAIAVGLVGVFAALASGVASTYRYRSRHTHLTLDLPQATGGIPIAFAALAAGVIGISGIAIVLTFALWPR